MAAPERRPLRGTKMQKLTLIEAGHKILEAEKIVITAHVSPDGDGIGSALGLWHYLRNKGKAAAVVFDDRLPIAFRFLKGYEEIIDISDRPEVQPGEMPADLLVVLDTDLGRIGRVREYVGENVTTVNIDHHRTNDEQADFLFCDYRIAAVAEIIYELIVGLSGQEGLTKEIADCLYTGICTDTGFFRYSNTRPATHRAAATLVEAGAEPSIISETLDARPAERQRALVAAVQTMELFDDGRIGGIFPPYEQVKDIESTDGFIDFVRVIDTVEVAVMIKESQPGRCKASLRSKGLDVGSVAMQFGGGGHYRAAGCTIEEPLTVAKAKIIEAVTALVEGKAHE